MGDDVDLSTLAVERWREKQLEAVLKSDLDTLKASYESPWCAAQHVDSLPPALVVQSPLVWSVLAGDPQLVRYLMSERSERIPFPHVIDCGCSLCRELRADARLRRLYADKLLPALASPMYQAHRSPGEDVLQQSLNLMRRVAGLTVLTADQRQRVLAEGSRTLALLLDACWTAEETFALLLEAANPEDGLGRLRKLADLGLREPLTHQAAQLVLQAAWTHGFRSVDLLPAAWLLRCLAAGLGYALMPIYILCPHPRLRPICQNARFVCALDTVAFVATIGLVVAWVATARDLNDNLAKAAVCGASPAGKLIGQIVFLVFVIGWVVKAAHHLFVLGPRRLLRFSGFFHWLHHLAMLCYLAGLPLTIVWASRLTQLSDSFLAGQANSTALQACVCARISVASMLCSTPENLSCLGSNLTAAYSAMLLDSLEPQVVASLMIGCGHVLVLLSVFSVAALQRHLGLLAVSLSRILKDLVNFGAVLLIAIFAWTCLLIALYRVAACSSPYFQTDGSVFQTVAWSLLTMSDRNDHLLSGTAAQHPSLQLLQLLGLLAHLSFVFVAAVLLISLLVAMMSETLIQLSETRLSEWLYRAALIKVKYLSIGADLPVPFNLLWPLHLLTLMLWDKISSAMKDAPKEPARTYLRQYSRLDYESALSRARHRVRVQQLACARGPYSNRRPGVKLAPYV